MASPTVAANAYASLARMMESGGAEKGGQTSGGEDNVIDAEYVDVDEEKK